MASVLFVCGPAEVNQLPVVWPGEAWGIQTNGSEDPHE